jgi:pimeloyl-ACP methyl ester carboxylesterase
LTLESPVQAPGVEEHYVTVDGLRVHYLRSGSGPPLVLLHGLLGYSFSWRFALPALAQHATVYALDLPGAGFSDRSPLLDCSFRGCARRLLSFLDHVGIGSCDLLGTSQGGAIVMMTAAAAPERVRRMVLAAPVNPWSPHGTRLAPFLSSAVVSPFFLRLAPRLKLLHRLALNRLYGDVLRIHPGTLEGYSAPFALPGSFEYGLSVLRSWNRGLRELEAILPRIADIPTLLIWGSLDAAVDPASGDQLRKQFRNCRLVTFAGVGHLPYEEAPEEFNQEVIEFLE